MFESKGVIEILLDDLINKDKLLEDSLALDIEDIEILDDIAIVYTEPKNLSEITSSLEKLNYKINSSEINKIPNTYVNISDPDVLLKLERLLDMLEDNDDVQNVWNNLFEE